MIHPPFPSAWLAAAQFERDRRQASYPAAIERQPEREDEFTADFQCWCCIAIWLEKGRCDMIGGFATPATDQLSWARLEQAAAKALASLEAKAAKAATDDTVSPHAVGIVRQRWEAVYAIHNALEAQVALAEATTRIMADARTRRHGKALEAA